MKVACMLIVCFATIGLSMAREINRENRLEINSINNSEHSGVSSSLIESRKRKPYHDLFFLMGGLQSLVAFVIIKIKIVLVTVTIIGAVALAIKVFGFFKYTDYFYKNDRPPIAPPPEYHGYHGPPPQPPIPYDHEIYGNDWSSYGEHYARSIRQFPTSMNMTEIMYSLMHVDKDECRARLICELEIMMTRSPFFNYFIRQPVTRHRPPSSESRSEICNARYRKCVESSDKRALRRGISRAMWGDSR